MHAGIELRMLFMLSSSETQVLCTIGVPNGIITACNVHQRSTALWKQHAPQLLVVLPMSQHWIVHLWAKLPPHPQYHIPLPCPSNGMLPSNPTMSSLPNLAPSSPQP
ncbi:hypothetical protein EMCRGX_G023205 [Ephydatia muelleri]